MPQRRSRATIPKQKEDSETPRSGTGTYIADQENKIVMLESRVATLEEEVEALKRSATEASDDNIVLLRTISRDAASQEIRELFASGETLFYSDIARRLRIDLPLVVEICQELQNEGEIGLDDDAISTG